MLLNVALISWLAIRNSDIGWSNLGFSLIFNPIAAVVQLFQYKILETWCSCLPRYSSTIIRPFSVLQRSSLQYRKLFRLPAPHSGAAAVWRLARKTGPLLYKLKDVEYTVHSVVGSLQFQFTTKKWDRQPLLGVVYLIFLLGLFCNSPPFITPLPYSLGETLSASVPAAHRPALRCHWL